LICLIRGRRETHWQTKVKGDMLVSRSAATVQEKFVLLNCRRLPGRLNTAETALLLGFQEHDIAPLIAGKILKPLGQPAPNAPKYFAATEIIARAEDRRWLSEATKLLSKHWLRKNRARTLTSSGAVKIPCDVTEL
jgi:hypothetical protein